MPFTNGISAWSLDGRVTSSHDHVGVMARIDGAYNDGPPGLWEWSQSEPTRWNEAYWEAVRAEIDKWLKADKSVVLRLVGWRNPDPMKAGTQWGLFGKPIHKGRDAQGFAQFMVRVCKLVSDVPASRLWIEPFSEFGFYRDCTSDRRVAQDAWLRVWDAVLPEIRSVLPDHRIIVGTYGYDNCNGDDSVFPAIQPPVGSNLIVPCHFYGPRRVLWNYGKGYRWKQSASAQDQVAARQPNPSEERWYLAHEFDGLPWTQAGLVTALEGYRQWCLRWGLMPYIGEWGACEPSIPSSARSRYNADCKAAIERLGMAHCEFRL